MNRTLLSLLAALLALTSCQKAQEASKAYDAVVASGKAAENMKNNLEASQARQDERRQHGDTLAISYQELQKYLPAAPTGYTADGPPQGEKTDVDGMHVSTASQQYRNGDKSLRVTLVDYAGAGALFTAATALMGGGLKIEDDNQYVRSFDPSQAEVKGLETFEKKSHKATIILGVADRFLATVEATGQNDAELAKSVAKTWPLGELAKR
ncbi:MAG: hypothetical protein ACRYFX_05895 [Janthinobacterium lividum]